MRLAALLRSPRAPLAAVLASLVITAPSLGSGWFLDDWLQQCRLLGLDPVVPERGAVTTLYSFWNAERNRPLVERGFSPWWLPEDARVDFFRPLAALSHALDARVAPGVAWVAHLHSILWGALLVAAAAALYRRLYGVGTTAGLAALLFALNDAHGSAVAWVANRNALIGGVLAAGVLAAHDAWRRHGRGAGAWLAPALLLAALLCAEGAIAVSAYLFAYALCLDRGSLARRLATLAPCAAVAVAWRVAYTAAGYGTSGTGIYVDPLGDPAGFAMATLLRLPALLASQWLSLPAIAVDALPPAAAAGYAAFAALCLLGLARALWPLLRRSATARFLALGSSLAALPACISVPQTRALVFVSLGATALLAALLCDLGTPRLLVGEPGRREPPPRASRALGYFLVFVHLLAAPALSVLGQLQVARSNERTLGRVDAAVPDDPTVRGRTVVFVSASESGPAYLGYARRLTGRPEPEAVRVLAPPYYAVELTGVDSHSLRVRVQAGFHSVRVDQRIRRRDDPLPIGARIELPGTSFEVLEHTDEGLIETVLVSFDLPLDDPSLLWLADGPDGLEPFAPPAPGETLRVPPAGARERADG